ncbi:hypothetical protein A2U01_0111867, partial [Trifolium medium]|nr:hypothetical protein [Trifolium medium]
VEQEERQTQHVPEPLEVKEPLQEEQEEDVEMYKAQLEPEEKVSQHRRKPFCNPFEGQPEPDIFP